MSEPTVSPSSAPASDPSYDYLANAEKFLEEGHRTLDQALSLIRAAKSLSPSHPSIGPELPE